MESGLGRTQIMNKRIGAYSGMGLGLRIKGIK